MRSEGQHSSGRTEQIAFKLARIKLVFEVYLNRFFLVVPLHAKPNFVNIRGANAVANVSFAKS